MAEEHGENFKINIETEDNVIKEYKIVLEYFAKRNLTQDAI